MKLNKKQKNAIYYIVPLIGFLFLFVYFIIAGTNQVAAKTYEKINLRQTILSKEENRIDFIFWSDCGACYGLTKAMNEWLSTKKHITLNKIPAAGGGWDVDAKLYYTMSEIAGIRINGLYDNYIDAIHIQKTLRNFSSKQEFIMKNLNITQEQFNDVFNSQSVSSKVNKAREIGWRLDIRSVPQLIVNGEYYINMQAFDSYDELFNEIERIIREKP